MLEQIHAHHFRALQGQSCAVAFGNGHTVSMQVDAVTEKPRSRRAGAPDGERMPFTVDLAALEPTTFLDGPCALDLPELGRIENIWMTRVATGIPAEHGCFQIVFA